MSRGGKFLGRLERFVARAKDWKHVVLLAVIILAFLVQPLASDRTRIEAIPHDALLTLALLLAFVVVFDSRVDRTVAFVAVVTAASNWPRYFLPDYGAPRVPSRTMPR
jgi:putative Mn2+ efflux pump MntP